jgi:hypothetical protein
MPMTNECQRNADLCVWLARQTKEIYAKIALFELANEFRALADRSDPPAWPIRVKSGY